MKTRTILTLIFMGAVAVGSLSAQTNTCTQASSCDTTSPVKFNPGIMGGPGIVISESATQSQLPEGAQKFLQTYYSRVMVGPVKHNVVKDTYNVTLGNGVKVTFNGKGEVDDITSEGTEPLYEPAIKAILPEKAYKHLADAGLLYEVTGIKNARGKGLRIDLLNAMPPSVIFDVDGVFIILDD